MSTPQKSLSVYIHWPFCRKKCPYCAFQSQVLPRDYAEVEEQLCDKYLQLLQYYAQQLEPRYLSSVFFGGGTPSLLQPTSLEILLEQLQRLWVMDEQTEISLEANPGTISASRLRDYAQVGVNRLSIGVQALNDTDLQILGRIHNVATAKTTIEHTSHYFDNYSIDLIYGRPQQTLEQWQQELAEALQLSPKHLSLYQLTIEPHTPFSRDQSLQRQLPSEETLLEMLHWNHHFTQTQGILPYEISNFALPGYVCVHNLRYWQNLDYLGIGPAAHGRITKPSDNHPTAVTMLPGVSSWLKQAPEQLFREQPLSATEAMEEMVFMGLRNLRDGLDLREFQRRFGQPLVAIFPRTSEFIGEKFLQQQNTHLLLTPKGLDVMDSLTGELLTSSGARPKQ